MARFHGTVDLPTDAARAFAWHLREGALERLTPPWEPARVRSRQGTIDRGGTVVLELRRGPFRLLWEAVHEQFENSAERRQFVDRQRRGPFHSWVHTHRVDPLGANRSRLTDAVDYVLPLGRLGQWVAGGSIAATLDRMFRYRHTQLADDLAMHGDFPMQKILVSGASGLVGQGLCALLATGGHAVSKLVRRPIGAADEIRWDPAAGALDPGALEGFDAVIHLSGANIAAQRFTESHKREVRESRVQSTALLAATLGRLARPPRTLLCASAIGYYGNRPEVPGEHLDEQSPPGTGFLAEVCQAWEAAADPARAAGLRVCSLRIGVVLTPKGGVLGQLLTPFRLGLGGRIGDGRQGMSWIDYDDLLGAFHHCLVDETISGPVNAVAPHPVSNADFVKALGRVLGRPTILPLPAPLIRAAFGELGQALLLEGARVFPTALERRGYRFRFPDLEASFRHQLGR